MFTETTKYIKLNQRGTPVLADTNTNIVPVGVAHEQGVSEESLLDQYRIDHPRTASCSPLIFLRTP